MSITVPTGEIVTGANGSGTPNPVMKRYDLRVARVGVQTEAVGKAVSTVIVNGDSDGRLTLVSDE